jgi:hypothetical protein
VQSHFIIPRGSHPDTYFTGQHPFRPAPISRVVRHHASSFSHFSHSFGALPGCCCSPICTVLDSCAQRMVSDFLPFKSSLSTHSLSPHLRRTLTKEQQLDYITAFKCLQSKPARTQSLYPGALTRYDDYVALHIAMTTQIHFVVCIL